MHVQRQTYAQTVEYDVCRSYIIAASFQLFNAMALALDQCANFNSVLCLWSFHGDVRDFGKSLRSVFEGGPSSVAFCPPLPQASAPSPARQEDRVPSSSGPMTGAQQWGKKERTEFGNSQLPDNSLKCPFRVISRRATGQRDVRFAPERDILRGEQQPIADIPPFIRQLVGRARARTATR